MKGTFRQTSATLENALSVDSRYGFKETKSPEQKRKDCAPNESTPFSSKLCHEDCVTKKHPTTVRQSFTSAYKAAASLRSGTAQGLRLRAFSGVSWLSASGPSGGGGVSRISSLSVTGNSPSGNCTVRATTFPSKKRKCFKDVISSI